jgi:small ligand-binding sensory domain FIST
LSAFASGCGADPDWARALARALDGMRAPPPGANLGFLYLSDRLAANAADVLDAVRRETGVGSWIGTFGVGVCGTGRECYDEPAVALLVGAFPPDSFAPFDAGRDELATFVARRPWKEPGGLGVVHLDPRNPRTFPLIGALSEASGSFLVGALTSSRGLYAQFAGAVSTSGLSGALFSPDVPVATALTQGCAPLGPTHLVTRARDNVALELDGRPALEVFKADIGELLARDLRRVAGYVFAAVPVEGSDIGDYMVRNIAGIDLRQGSIAIADELRDGQPLMFCRRDRQSAEADMERMLDGLKRRLPGPPKAALYHSCLARGPNMFGEGSAELRAIEQALGPIPLAGFFGNGEISNARIYTYTGVLTVFL